MPPRCAPPAPGEKDIAAAGEAMIGTVLAVLAGYGVTGDERLHATRGLRAIIHGFVSLDAAGGFRLKLDLDESFDRLLGAFARDLAAREQAGARTRANRCLISGDIDTVEAETPERIDDEALHPLASAAVSIAWAIAAHGASSTKIACACL